MTIDLRSDTITRPSAGMLDAMHMAETGDDVFGDDPTVLKLETKLADMFGMEKGLFCPSGTMTNQIAINVHTRPGDEVICERMSHVYQFEGGGIARNSGVSVCLIDGDQGRITAEQVLESINPDDIHKPVTLLVAVENTTNKGGGACYDFAELNKISKVCKEHNLRFHLDGARLFNALAETAETCMQYGEIFDSISICLSKGLGAPIGSVLLGDNAFYKRAKRVRKVFGGGMRQVGLIAAAGLYAVENHIEGLKKDHLRAREIEDVLKGCNYVKYIYPSCTNILIFKLVDEVDANDFLENLKHKGILALSLGPGLIRFVTHRDITDEMMPALLSSLQGHSEYKGSVVK